MFTGVPFTISKSRIVIILLIFSIPLFFLNIHSAHSQGGDDYAHYINEARNIAHGQPFYKTNFVFNNYNNSYSPPQYPPGFPLLLAPVVKIWGIAIQPMCYFNTVIAAMLLFVFFAFFRKYMSVPAALCMAVVITYSGFMIELKQSVLSDVPGLFFVMLYLVTRNAERMKWQRIIALAFFATMAILIRTQAILLVAAELIYFTALIFKELYTSRQFPIRTISKSPSLLIISGTILLLFLVNKFIFYCPNSTTGFYVDFIKSISDKGVLTIIRDNINAFLASIREFFHYNTDSGIRTAIVTIMESAGLVFGILGFMISITKRLSFDDIFFVLVCGMMLWYPIHDSRYFLPAVAILYYYCYVAFAKIIPAITSISPRKIGLALTIVYLFAGFRYVASTTHQPQGYVPAPGDQQAFDYISKHVNDSDIIISTRPRQLTLYTNKRCMMYAWKYPPEINKRINDSMHVKYLLFTKGLLEEHYNSYMHTVQHPVDSVNIAEGYTLYTLR